MAKKWTDKDELGLAEKVISKLYADTIQLMDATVTTQLVSENLIGMRELQTIKRTADRSPSLACEEIMEKMVRNASPTKLHRFIHALTESYQEDLAKIFADLYLELRAKKQRVSIGHLVAQYPDLPTKYRHLQVQVSSSDPISSKPFAMESEAVGKYGHSQPQEFQRLPSDWISSQPFVMESRIVGDAKAEGIAGAAASSSAHQEKPLQAIIPLTDESYTHLCSRSETYEMKAKPRGIGLIINVEDNRPGCHKDVEKMEDLFKQLSLVTRVFPRDWCDTSTKCTQQCTSEDILQVLRVIAQPTDGGTQKLVQESDCLMVCIMSHGQRGGILGSDRKLIMYESIFDLFAKKSCRYFVGKPKVFIVQACRGVDDNRGVIHADSNPDFNQMDDCIEPEAAHIFAAYSTVPGFKAYRHTDNGSWFINDLYDVFIQNAFNCHLTDLMTKVTNQLCKRIAKDENDQNLKQCCEIRSTLNKFLYFFPGR